MKVKNAVAPLKVVISKIIISKILKSNHEIVLPIDIPM